MDFFTDYIDWHYLEVWPKLLILWRNLILFPFYYFSLPLHLKTLFSPWKRQQMAIRPGFHLDDFFGVLGFNLITRIIGAIIRFSTVIYGLFFMLLMAVLGVLPAAVWLFMPGISLLFYLARKPDRKHEPDVLLHRANGNLQTLAFIMFRHPEGEFILTHLGINPKWFAGEILNSEIKGDFTLFKNFLSRTPPSGLSVFYRGLNEVYPPVKKIFDEEKITPDEVNGIALWYESLYGQDYPPLILDLERIRNIPGIGKNWAYGYTVEFDKFATDITRRTSSYPILIGREKEIEKLERILVKSQSNNAIIIGEPGTSRHILVETLAHRITTGSCLPLLTGKRILKLNMHSLVSSKPSVLEAKGLAGEILTEAESSGNIIIVIDDFDKYVSSGDGRIDLSDVLTKIFSGTIGFIGITSPGAYHRYIEKNPDLKPLFETVEVFPPSVETVLDELKYSIVPVLEKRHSLIITYRAILKAIEDADKFISSTPFPSKAIELLDQACIYHTSENKNNAVLTDADIDSFLTEKLHISVGKMSGDEKEKLMHLEELLHRRIINQEEAVRAISAALRRGRLNVSSGKKPVGSFLFLGPTGVGKTETAKALAATYFGSEDYLLRFDMSQYQKEEGIERLIGSVKTGSAGELTSRLSDRPFSVILLDEFEKSDKQIYNLSLTLLDEGYLTDADGRKVSAKNSIIIATSNAGAEFIRENINKGITGPNLQSALIEYIQSEKIFSPELLNRFDSVVVFTPLSEGHLREVAKLMLENLNRRLKPKEVSVEITPELIKQLAAIGYSPEFGGRAMRRTIEDTIEDQVARKLLSENFRKGETIRISL